MLRLLEHPLALHAMTLLRDRQTPAAEFRALAHELGVLLAVEATRHLPLVDRHVETPLEALTGKVLAPPSPVVVPILRAGLALLPPFLDLLGEARVGYIGLERNHATAEARSYYCKLPALAGAPVFLVDPMLATGGSACQALTLLKEHGAADPCLVCIVAAPDGVARVEREHPGTEMLAAALDRELNVRKYILPGLGDFGDRLYGT